MMDGYSNALVITGRYGTQVKLVLEQENPDYDLGQGTATGKVKIIATLAEPVDGQMVENEQKKVLLEGVHTRNNYSSGSILGRLGYRLSKHFGVAPQIHPLSEGPELEKQRQQYGEVVYRVSLDIPDGQTETRFVAAVRRGLYRIRDELECENNKNHRKM